MIKIAAYIGSYRENNSNSLRVVKSITDELKKIMSETISLEIISPRNYNIKNCIGCNNCFYKGKCNIVDDMDKAKKILDESNIIIFAAPVYLHQIPGNMKTFIDRFSSWIHILKLRGKVGISISVSGNNGNESVNQYLADVIGYLGMSVIGNYAFEAKDFLNQKVYMSIIRQYAKEIKRNIELRQFIITDKQNTYFKNMKKIIMQQQDGLYEKNYWIENNFNNYETFSELFEVECKI